MNLEIQIYPQGSQRLQRMLLSYQSHGDTRLFTWSYDPANTSQTVAQHRLNGSCVLESSDTMRSTGSTIYMYKNAAYNYRSCVKIPESTYEYYDIWEVLN